MGNGQNLVVPYLPASPRLSTPRLASPKLLPNPLPSARGTSGVLFRATLYSELIRSDVPLAVRGVIRRITSGTHGLTSKG